MTILATCGHEITSEEMAKGYIIIKDYDDLSPNGHCIRTMVVCPKCKPGYKKLILHTIEEQNKWLGIQRTNG